jgi:hypothetical protein
MVPIILLGLSGIAGIVIIGFFIVSFFSCIAWIMIVNYNILISNRERQYDEPKSEERPKYQWEKTESELTYDRWGKTELELSDD